MDEGEKWYLDTAKAERNVMLIKTPHVIDSSFRGQRSFPYEEDDNSLAKVTVSIDPLCADDQSQRQVTMELVNPECGNAPKYYSMNEPENFNPEFFFFSESFDEGKLAVEGKINKKFDMKPHKGNLEEYWKLCRERTNKYMTKTRQIQVIDNDNGLHMRPLPGMIGLRTSATNDKKKVPVKASDMKRTRRDRGQMEEIMFKLFERQPNWTLKQLLNDTDQPEQFLKDLLRDLCVYNNKGANQGTYELKPEYKKSSVEEQNPSNH